MVDMKQILTCASLCLCISAGCGGPAYEYDSVVTGTVTIDGELANSGIVTFHPTDGGKVAIGRIHTDGSYSLRTGQGDLQQVDGGTVVPGDYVVTVSITGPSVEGSQVAEGGPPVAGPSLIASKYASKETSDLKHTVKPGPQVIVLELERVEEVPIEAEEAETTADESETDSIETKANKDAAVSEGEPEAGESSNAVDAAKASDNKPASNDAAVTAGEENANP